jgi:hypothetical protein
MGVRPISRKDAFSWIKATHSHLKKLPAGDLFRVGVFVEGRLVCVALAGRPVASQYGPYHTIEVSRVASDGSTNNAASKAIGAILRAATALGYKEAVTYTMLCELGTSYLATGWSLDGVTSPPGWGRDNGQLNSEQPSPKYRWKKVLNP